MRKKTEQELAQEEEFLRIYNETGSQLKAYTAVGWEKTKASKFVKKIRETAPERLKETKAPKQEPIVYKRVETAQNPHTATETSQTIKYTRKEEKAVCGANTKSQKQVFSFRAVVEDVAKWRAYATATGQTVEGIAAAAMNEYLEHHKLTGTEQVIFEAMAKRR